MLEQALNALKTLDWGADLLPLAPIDAAIVASAGDAAARSTLEKQLIDLLSAPLPRAALDYVCRKLMQIGGDASVPPLAKMLLQDETSHLARYALERIESPSAAEALRSALSTATSPMIKVGVIGSLGVRRDEASVAALSTLLNDADSSVAAAAASALGAIRSPQAIKALAAARSSKPEVSRAVCDASFACAESMLVQGNRSGAMAIYKLFQAEGHPDHVRLAARQGMLKIVGTKD
jgi:HEAT repeat protein